MRQLGPQEIGQCGNLLLRQLFLGRFSGLPPATVDIMEKQTGSKKILYIQYTNPALYPPLEHSSHALAQRGWRILFLGVETANQKLRFPPNPLISVKQLPSCSEGWRQKIHYLLYSLWVIYWYFHWRPQWIYASDWLSCPVTLIISLLSHNCKIIYHEHDSPPGASRNLFERCFHYSRRRLAGRCERCVLPNRDRVLLFADEFNDCARTVCVWNCPRREEASSARVLRAKKELRLWYHGTIVPARVPIALLNALAMLPRVVTLHVVGYETSGSLGYKELLREKAHQLGIEERVVFLDCMPRSALLSRSREFDVGLSLIAKDGASANRRYLVGASNKPFDYLAAGLAVLVSDLPGWENLYVKPGYGLSCDLNHPTSIATKLYWCLENLSTVVEMGERGRERILSEWNYECQFQPVLEQIECGRFSENLQRAVKTA